MSAFGFGDISNLPNQSESICKRIKAKASFWAFMEELWPEIENWHSTPEELTIEITKTAIKLLHPHFEGTEMADEVANVLNTFKTKKPQQFMSIVTDETIQGITARLKNYY